MKAGGGEGDQGGEPDPRLPPPALDAELIVIDHVCQNLRALDFKGQMRVLDFVRARLVSESRK